MSDLSRRDFLQRLAALYSGALLMGCSRKGDPFARERVCIHVLHPQEFIPAPLAEKTDGVRPPRSSALEYFNIGLPELAVCESRARLLDLFQYFWPFTREDLESLGRAITLLYQKPALYTARDVEEFARFLRDHRTQQARAGTSSAVLFTWNDFTRQWSPEIAAACQESGVQEFVVFKNPEEPPYLCDFPAKQKGFKRSPR